MQRTRLTVSIIPEMYIAWIPFLFALTRLNYDYLNFGIISIVTLLLVFAVVVSYYFKQMKRIEFDENNLYEFTNNIETIIPFENVKEMKLSANLFKDREIWKMIYLNSNNKITTIRFVPKFSTNEFFKLQNLIKPKNTNAIIESVPNLDDLNIDSDLD